MPVSGQSHPELFPLYYERKLLEYVREKLIALKFGQRFTLPANSGRKAVFYRSPSLPPVTTPLTDQPTPPPSEMPNLMPVEVTIQEYGNYITLYEFAEVTSFVPLVDHVTNLLSRQARKTLEAIAMKELTSGLNVFYAGGVNARSKLTGSQKLTKEDIREAVAFLQSEDVPPFDEDDCYVCLIHPKKFAELFTSTELIMLSVSNTSAFEKGMVARFAGVRFYVTTALPTVVGGNGSTVYQTLVIGKDAYGIVDLDGTTLQMKYMNTDNLGRVKSIGWVAYFAVKRLEENAIVRIESN